MKEWLAVFRNGLMLENPLTRLMIGLCATLAVSTQIEGSFFLGAAVVFVLVMSNTIVSTFRRSIPEQVRIPVFIVVIASFVTIVDLTMKAYFPGVYSVLGIWIPLIVVNCAILGRAEAYAYHNPVLLSIADGLGMGVGYLIVICVMAVIRELLGSGSIVFMGHTLVSLPAGYVGPSMLVLFPGGFLTFGFLIAAVNAWEKRKARARSADVGACHSEGVAS
ncbi:MAG: electron transport complex subunit RsxE [Coriobacteriia bacterium]